MDYKINQEAKTLEITLPGIWNLGDIQVSKKEDGLEIRSRKNTPLFRIGTPTKFPVPSEIVRSLNLLGGMELSRNTLKIPFMP